MQQSNNSENPVEWLTVLLAIVASAALAGAYVLLCGETLAASSQRLLLAMIPSALVVLVAVAVVYFVFTRKGIPRGITPGISALEDVSTRLDGIDTRIAQAVATLPSVESFSLSCEWQVTQPTQYRVAAIPDEIELSVLPDSAVFGRGTNEIFGTYPIVGRRSDNGLAFVYRGENEKTDIIGAVILKRGVDRDVMDGEWFQFPGAHAANEMLHGTVKCTKRLT